MAIEHEPGCDRQHTVRQRCNQNALFAEQGEVPVEMSAAEERPSQGAISAVSERPEPEAEVVEEIVAIREEVLMPEPAPEGSAPEFPQPEETAAADGYGLLIGVAVAFAIVTVILVTLLRRRGGDD